MNLTKTSRETRIMVAAQQTVDEWIHNVKRGRFSSALETAATMHLGNTEATRADRMAFRRAAEAIRLGRGHSRSNPGPILDIIRQTLSQVREHSRA
ncbi:MAG: hypothetical protein M3Y37_01385 [Chloroflexota bacterium]|nr:hypothetical protein [Chloroflexota bacterium]